jgi:hypothetical protein
MPSSQHSSRSIKYLKPRLSPVLTSSHQRNRIKDYLSAAFSLWRRGLAVSFWSPYWWRKEQDKW